MTANDLITRAKDLASQKTMYVKGCPGKRMNQANKLRYASNCSYNSNRAEMIFAATEDTIGIDEVQMFNLLIPNDHFNNIGDIMDRCHDISKNFDTIIPGEIVFMQDRAGIFIGDGKVITCSAAGIGETIVDGWVSHRKMMFVDYVDNELVDIVEKATSMEKVVNSIVEEINNDETDVEVRDGGTGSRDRVQPLPSQAKSYDRGNGRRRS
jgi:hypothetical protein